VEQALVIGIGDPARGDDGVGHAVVGRLRARSPAGVRLETHWGEGAALMELWAGYRRVLLVDAMLSGAPAGTLRWFDGASLPGQVRFPRSTHQFGLAEAARMAAVLGTLPGELWVLGIEGGDFTAGAGLSPAVEGAVEAACRQVLDRLEG
jgi:hydrogenase maturation protease